VAEFDKENQSFLTDENTKKHNLFTIMLENLGDYIEKGMMLSLICWPIENNIASDNQDFQK
jgi:hypothetical protein